jgi:hypothetical protein
MKLQSLLLRSLLFVSATLLFLGAQRVNAQSNTQTASQSSFTQTPVPARITQAIDETQLMRLKGNVHPLARPEFDQGAVPDSTPMRRMLLLLQRSPEQEAALQQFMAEQMSNESPNFHQWLTPQQFGTQFGPADSDIQTVTSWLASHGFAAIRVAPGRNVVEFSGNAGQVRSAFHAEIHKFLVKGEERQSNTADPQIPAALTPVVAGIVSLHNFPSKSMRRSAGVFTRMADGRIVPQFTGSDSSGPFYAIGPADFAKIYSIPATLNGTGGNIAIIGFSDIDVTDAHDFRALFGLPVNDPVVVANGPDPGFNGEEGEADLDTQWAGAVAPNATIHYILSEGTLTADPLFLGAEYVVDNNSDDVMSLSFGQCEAGLTTASLNFLNALWEQAAAQGITVTVSAGDNGTAGCDDFTIFPNQATHGIAVSGIASTPFNIAVGGTDFDDAGTQTNFWNSTNSTDGKRESALGYIHEIPWNNSCAATATPGNLTTCTSAGDISAGSGGPSAVYAKPAWQNGITPNGIAAGDNHRYLPDVSLFASNGPASRTFYIICQADAITPQPPSPPSCVPDVTTGHFQFFGTGGTSASAPSFAGIIALIGQSEAAAGRSRRQGNANQVLYKIAQTAANSCNSSTQPLAPPATCVFFNITKNTNSVPCAGGSPNCSSTTSGTTGVLVTTSGATKTPAFTATAGSGSIPSYNLATGLGSVNVTGLAAAWGVAVGTFKGTTSTLLINNSSTPTPITHGTAVTAKVTVAVVTPATGTPTGDVSVVAPLGTINGGNNGSTLSVGTVTITGVILPGGTYNVTAHYPGDGTFAPSDSTGVPVTVNTENSRLQYSIIAFDPVTGTITNPNATTVAYGSPYILRFDILNSSTFACTPPGLSPAVTTGCAFDARGSVTITDNSAPLDQGTFPVNSEGSGEDQPIQLTGGTHALSATYSGDNSYNPVTTPVTDTVTVTPASTTATLSASPSPGLPNQAVALSVTISSQSNSTQGATGSVTFKDGTTTLGTATVTPVGATSTTPAGGTASMNATFTAAGTHSLTVVYGGDTNYATSTSSAVTLAVGQTTTTTVTSSAMSISSGGSVTLTATVASTATTGASPTGTVQFMNGSTALGTAQTCSAVSGASSPTCKATLTTTLAFLAPPSGPNGMPKLRVPWILLIGVVLLILLLLDLEWVPARYRRAYATASLLLLAGLVAGLATGCGKNYGGGGGGTHYDTITAVYSGDTTYSGSTSPAITITVQ